METKTRIENFRTNGEMKEKKEGRKETGT